MKFLVSPIALLLIATATAIPSVAQSPDSTAAHAAVTNADPETIGQSAAALLDRIRTVSDEYHSYGQRLLRASSEDSLVLGLQIDGRIDDFMTVLPQLADHYVSEPQTPGELDLNERIKVVYRVVTADIWELIADYRAEVDRLRAERTTTPPDGRLALEYRISRQLGRLNIATVFAGEHVQAMTGLGLATIEAQETYRSLLVGRADELMGRIDLGVERIDKYQGQAKDLPGDADLGLLLAATRHTLQANTTSLKTIVPLMAAAGLDDEGYRTYLITVTQDIASGMLDARATATLLRRMWQRSVAWLSSHGPTYLFKLLIFAAIMFAGRLLAKLTHRAVDASLQRARVDLSQLLHRTLVSAAHNLVMALALMFGLSQIGLNLGPVLAGFGVIGFILGFAMQDSLSNFASGLMILFYRPYDVGDLVDISGAFGKVENMSLVSTSILTLDNQKLVVPNSKIWGDVIKNVTDQHLRRVDMTFGIGYSDDIPQAEEVLNAIVAEHEKVLDKPEPVVKLHTLNDSSVDFVVRPWVKTEDYWEVYWDVTRAVKLRFDAAQISIPFPQRDVHIYNEDQAAEVEG